MEQKFKKILQKSKAWHEGAAPLGKSFEGALFSQTAWPFTFMETDLLCEPITNKIYAPPLQKVPGTFSTLVLFLGDTFRQEENKEDLLGKMIAAMKLRPGEFNRVLFNESLDDISELEKNVQNPDEATSELYKKILEHRPEVVVSLGATVTNVLLGKREKLSTIHGQFIDKSVSAGEFTHHFSLVPLFHPDFLMINPNMKRTAWIDLQKVMEKVGKI